MQSELLSHSNYESSSYLHLATLSDKQVYSATVKNICKHLFSGVEYASLWNGVSMCTDIAKYVRPRLRMYISWVQEMCSLFGTPASLHSYQSFSATSRQIPSIHQQRILLVFMTMLCLLYCRAGMYIWLCHISLFRDLFVPPAAIYWNVLNSVINDIAKLYIPVDECQEVSTKSSMRFIYFFLGIYIFPTLDMSSVKCLSLAQYNEILC